MFRKSIFNLHMFVGLIAAIVLFAQGLSGSILVFENEIFAAMNRDLVRVQAVGKPLPLNEIKQSLEASHPGFVLEDIQTPRNDRAAGVAGLISKSGQEIAVTYDPYTGRELGNLEHARGAWIQWLHQFHEHLGLGRVGSQVAAWSAVLLLGLSITGIVLWWPRKIIRVQWKATGRRWFDLHNTVGFFSAIFLFIFALTGIVIQWNRETENLLQRFSNAAPQPKMTKPAAVPPGTPIAQPDTLAQAATAAASGASVTWLQMSPDGQPVRAILRYPEDRTPMGRTVVMLDPHTAATLSVVDIRKAPFSYRVPRLWSREIHTGDIYGWPTRILACVFSLALPLMSFTGPLLWWKGRKKSISKAYPTLTVSKS